MKTTAAEESAPTTSALPATTPAAPAVPPEDQQEATVSDVDAAHDYLIIGARKKGNASKPILSRATELEAFAAAAAFRTFHYTVEVWHRITEKK